MISFRRKLERLETIDEIPLELMELNSLSSSMMEDEDEAEDEVVNEDEVEDGC